MPRFCSSSNPFQCQYLFKPLLYSSQIIPCLRRIQKIICVNHNSLCFRVLQILKPLWQYLAGHGADRTYWHTCWECVLNTCHVETTTAEKLRSGASFKRLLPLHVHQKLGFDLWLIFEPRRGHIQTNMTYMYLLFDPRAKVTFTLMCHLSICFIFITPLMNLKLFYFPCVPKPPYPFIPCVQKTPCPFTWKLPSFPKFRNTAQTSDELIM